MAGRRRHPPGRGPADALRHRPHHPGPAEVRRRPHRRPGPPTAAAPGHKDEPAKWSRGRQAADVIGAFPVRACAAEWTGVLKRLRPRLYSISSSPLAHPGEVRPDRVRRPLRQRPRPGPQGRLLQLPRGLRRRRALPGVRAALAPLPAARRTGHTNDHGRPGYRGRTGPDWLGALRHGQGVGRRVRAADGRRQAPRPRRLPTGPPFRPGAVRSGPRSVPRRPAPPRSGSAGCTSPCGRSGRASRS